MNSSTKKARVRSVSTKRTLGSMLMAFEAFVVLFATLVAFGLKAADTTVVWVVGLALALDVLGAASGLGAQAQWSLIGIGVAFALAAAATFGLALVLTQHETTGVDGRVRTLSTMSCVLVLGLSAVATQGGFHMPTAEAGWWGLAGLTFLYGTAFTIMFTVLPRLGVVGNSAIMNVEPIFALVLAWVLLGQAIAPVQVVGGLVVVGTVIFLGLRKR
ncbi:MAG: hypothetical protein RLZZ603_1179 [Actinomycetota bacterium]